MTSTGCLNDGLVQLLNRAGYQPIVLPRTNVKPPEMYTFADGRLIRRGPLAKYLPTTTKIPTLQKGKLPDELQHKESSRKKLSAAASFLKDALKCIGVTSTPKIDLSFAKGCDLTFSFTDMTYEALDPSSIDHLLEGLETGAIPEEYVSAGHLHIAYDYAYAKGLTMHSGQNAKFKADLKAVKVESFIDVGSQAKVEFASETTISFKSTDGHPAAFAFKVGRLEHRKNRRAFFPEEVMGKGFVADEGEAIPYLLHRGVVLHVL
jgi:hypothetical protein